MWNTMIIAFLPKSSQGGEHNSLERNWGFEYVLGLGTWKR